MKCPVCCETFTGTRCPHCGMRVSDGGEERLFSGGQPRPASRQAARPVQRQPVRRRGKVSLAAFERRQAASRKNRRALAWVIAVFVAVVLFSMLPGLLLARPATPEPVAPEPVAPATSQAWQNPYEELEEKLQSWADQEDNGLSFFYTSEDDYMNAALYVSGMEDAAALADEDPDVWTGMLEICRTAYDSARARMDELGEPDLALMVLGMDAESGELMLCMEGNSVLYSAVEP